MPFCPNCSDPYEEGHLFCKMCGTKFEDSPSNQPPTAEKLVEVSETVSLHDSNEIPAETPRTNVKKLVEVSAPGNLLKEDIAPTEPTTSPSETSMVETNNQPDFVYDPKKAHTAAYFAKKSPVETNNPAYNIYDLNRVHIPSPTAEADVEQSQYPPNNSYPNETLTAQPSNPIRPNIGQPQYPPNSPYYPNGTPTAPPYHIQQNIVETYNPQGSLYNPIRPIRQSTSAVRAARAYFPPGSLFDPNRMYYVINTEFWGLGFGKILDEDGQVIGKMSRKILSLRGKIRIRELDGSLSAVIHEKILSIRPTYTLMDHNESIIGRISKTLLSIYRPKFYFKDPSGYIEFTAQGGYKGHEVQIYRGDSEANVVAIIRKTDTLKDLVSTSLFNFSDRYTAKIIDPSIDRRKVIGFVIAIHKMIQH
jgi:uncharacterized protein YxjI